MGAGVHLWIGLPHVSILADQVADPFRVRRALVVASSIGQTDRAVGIAEKRKVETELIHERPVLIHRIEAHAEDVDVLVVELLVVVAEPATFERSPGGVGLGVEPEDDVLAFVVAQANGLA